jgi:hypothetical protein
MSRAPAPIRRPSSSRRGWPTSRAGQPQHRWGARPIQLGSTWMQLTMLGKTTLAQSAWPRSAVGTLTLSLAVKDQGWW